MTVLSYQRSDGRVAAYRVGEDTLRRVPLVTAVDHYRDLDGFGINLSVLDRAMEHDWTRLAIRVQVTPTGAAQWYYAERDVVAEAACDPARIVEHAPHGEQVVVPRRAFVGKRGPCPVPASPRPARMPSALRKSERGGLAYYSVGEGHRERSVGAYDPLTRQAIVEVDEPTSRNGSDVGVHAGFLRTVSTLRPVPLGLRIDWQARHRTTGSTTVSWDVVRAFLADDRDASHVVFPQAVLDGRMTRPVEGAEQDRLL